MKGETTFLTRQPPGATAESEGKLARQFVERRAFNDQFKSGIKDAAGLGAFSILRRAEQRLSVRQLDLLLKPFAFSRAAVNTVFKRPGFHGDPPPFLHSPQTLGARIRWRADVYRNQILRFFPDRLAGEKWMAHCRMEGLDYLRDAQGRGRRMVLAFCHFGPYFLLRCWLRAAGFQAATFVGNPSATRIQMNRLQDRLSPRPEIPVVLHSDQLREMVEFLSAGHPLLVALDVPAHKSLDVPFCEGWTFQMATGPIRLASHHGAEMIPCSIMDEGRWRFRIKFGPPVPRDFLTSEADWPRAGRFMMDQMLPDFRARPGQCWADLTRCLKRNASSLDVNS